MKKINLVEYGAQTLNNNPNLKVFYRSGFRDHLVEFQANANARDTGSTPVATRIRDKEIPFSMMALKDTYRTLEDVWTELNRSLEDGGRYLRIIRTWDDVTQITTDSGWTLSDDAVNRSLTYTKRWLDAAIQFDADVSVSGNNQATITNSSGTGINISQYDGMGNFEFWLDINNIEQLQGIVIIVGSDSGNYLLGSITEQFDGSPIVEGRNKFSVAWSDMIETGNVDPGLMGRYVSLAIQYSASQTDITGIVFGGLIWQYEQDTVNFRAYELGIVESTQKEYPDFRQFELRFSAYKGIGEGTNQDLIYQVSAVSSVSNDFVIDLGGSAQPRPVLTIKFTGITNLAAMTLRNKTTGDLVTITRTWTAGDNLIIDTESKTVTVNNAPVDFTNVLPRFTLGLNRVNISLVATTQNTISQTTNNANLRGEVA